VFELTIFFEFFEEFLGVRPRLRACSGSHVLPNHVPVLSEEFESIYKLVVLLICPFSLVDAVFLAFSIFVIFVFFEVLNLPFHGLFSSDLLAEILGVVLFVTQRNFN